MKDAYEILRLKEIELSRVKAEVEALGIVAPLLSDEADAGDDKLACYEPLDCFAAAHPGSQGSQYRSTTGSRRRSGRRGPRVSHSPRDVPAAVRERLFDGRPTTQTSLGRFVLIRRFSPCRVKSSHRSALAGARPDGWPGIQDCLSPGSDMTFPGRERSADQAAGPSILSSPCADYGPTLSSTQMLPERSSIVIAMRS